MNTQALKYAFQNNKLNTFFIFFFTFFLCFDAYNGKLFSNLSYIFTNTLAFICIVYDYTCFRRDYKAYKKVI